MKWIGIIITLAAVVPFSWWLRRNPNQAPKIWMLMGFLPFVTKPFHLFMAFISWVEWPGYVAGAEFHVQDALALAIYLSLPAASRPLPFRLSMVLYFLAVLLSTIQAAVPLAALFYPWQLARMFLMYAVVTRACADPRVPPALLKGMAIGLFMEAGIAIWQRFGLGMLQATGTLEHQNILGLLSHLIVFPFFALLLTKQRNWLPAAVTFAGIVVEVLTTSRATIGLAAFGYSTLFVLSAVRQFTYRKMVILLSAAAIIAMVTPLILASLDQRKYFNDEVTSNDARTSYIQAAEMILSDHPYGIGSNHFVFTANVEGYYRKAGVAPAGSAGFVHNVYLLVATETGYFGLITFLLLLVGPLLVAFRCGLRSRGDVRNDLLLGLGVGLLTVYIHSFFEWVFISFQFQYIFAMQVGLVAGLADQLGYWRRTDANKVRIGVSALPFRPSARPQAFSWRPRTQRL